mmetsp:Transcript_112158/g.229616  ORF Transcript_112158/g.229616 Transcript_112158/m.229616 type:complete len:250 (+) Transcript_112158:3-752(+)
MLFISARRSAQECERPLHSAPIAKASSGEGPFRLNCEANDDACSAAAWAAAIAATSSSVLHASGNVFFFSILRLRRELSRGYLGWKSPESLSCRSSSSFFFFLLDFGSSGNVSKPDGFTMRIAPWWNWFRYEASDAQLGAALPQPVPAPAMTRFAPGETSEAKRYRSCTEELCSEDCARNPSLALRSSMSDMMRSGFSLPGATIIALRCSFFLLASPAPFFEEAGEAEALALPTESPAPGALWRHIPVV